MTETTRSHDLIMPSIHVIKPYVCIGPYRSWDINIFPFLNKRFIQDQIMTGSTLLFENRKNDNSQKRKRFKEQKKLRKNKYFHIIVSYT